MVVTEYLDYLWELGELPVYILVVLALHGSQVAMVWPLLVPGDLHTLAATSKMWGIMLSRKVGKS